MDLGFELHSVPPFCYMAAQIKQKKEDCFFICVSSQKNWSSRRHKIKWQIVLKKFFFQPPPLLKKKKKSCCNFVWGTQDLILVQLILIIKNTLRGVGVKQYQTQSIVGKRSILPKIMDHPSINPNAIFTIGTFKVETIWVLEEKKSVNFFSWNKENI